MRMGDMDEARLVIDDVAAAMPGDQQVIALQEALRRRAG